MERKDSSKLNIAIIHPDLGIGGAERLIVDAAVELSSNGHNVHIFTSHHDKTRCFEETVSGLRRCSADEVEKAIQDMLLAQHMTILRRIYRKPIDFVEEITTGMADLILVNSKFTASTFAKTFKHLNSRGVRPAVLYPAVNVDQFDEPNTTKQSFLSINRFERKKNIELAISAFAMLYNSQEDFIGSDNKNELSLIVAGGFDKRLRENVEYLEELKNLAKREGVSHQVRFITSCPTSERNTLISECLCVIYTPKDEHFGIVPIEAMAAHKPVIACNSGGPTETIKNGVTGYLSDPSPKDFSTAMAKFISDPQLTKTMGKEARQHVVESFSTKIFGKHLNSYIVDTARRKRD